MATFKANVQPAQAYRSGYNESGGFLVKKIGGSVNSIGKFTQLWKSFTTQKTRIKIKRGTVSSVLTSDVNDQIVVS